MTTKDFKAGDTVYILSHFRLKEPRIVPVTAKSVGRKYVTVDDGRKTQYEETGSGCQFLTNKNHYGEEMYLFRTEQDIKDYLEKRELVIFLSRLDFHNLDLSLEQLKRIKEIIEE